MSENNNIDNKETKVKSNSYVESSKKNFELIENWYQCYYFWNTAVIANAIVNSNTAAKFLINNNNINATFQYGIGGTTNLNSVNNLVQQQNQQQRPTNQQQQQPSVVAVAAQQIINRADSTNSRDTTGVQITIFKVPSLFRRFIAELLDALYIQCFKIIIAILLLNYTNLVDEDSFRLFDLIEDIFSEDNLNNIRLPIELLLLEVIYVLISVFFEVFCLYKKGYTPGKYLLNLRVVSCQQINELLTPGHIQVLPGSRLSFKSILIRTCLKNFSIVFLFPTIIFFLLPAFMEYGQTSYDKASESIVVQNI